MDVSPHSQPRKFEYTPLESPDAIRVLHIDDTPLNTPTLKATIYHVYRHGAAADTPWTAISYRWGDPNDLVPISLKFALKKSTENSCSEDYAEYQELQVPRSALTTLRALHHQGCIVGKKVWMDAISINQADLVEKGVQVRSMDEIYQLAVNTVVYVGPSLPSTERAIQFMSKLEAYFDSLQASNDSTRMKGFSFEHLFQATSTSRQSEDWLALRDHLARPWFTRTWIIQEAVLSDELNFIWGEFSLPWERLKMFCGYERQFRFGILLYEVDSPARKVVAAMKNIDKLKQNRAGFSRGWRCTLSFALYCCDESSATDPRDKVYGLLGLLHDLRSRPGSKILPDYSKATSTVYTEVAKDFTAASDSFDLMYAAGIGHIRDVEGLPSWAPDLSRPLPMYPAQSHCAGKGQAFDLLPLRFERNDMVIQAFLIDKVVSVASSPSTPAPALDIEDDPYVISHIQGGIDLLKVVHGGFWSDAVFDMFSRTLVADMDTYLEREPSKYGPVCESLDVIRCNGIREFSTASSTASKHDRQTYLTAVAAHPGAGNVLCMAAKNSLGIVPRFTATGDLVCVCPGSKVPFVVRATGLSSAGKEVFRLVGCAFFLSLNNGEGLGVGPLQEIIFR
ncbi:hypothetical protein H2201_007609 [Coniosporium apollinis]|uniref:Heterokaryon incompatibility domain-containing protein n=2 Tax=Coniosporium TaxID=2810619 RepID=A0ABQ9NL80_9PEZI|nr:hypothetical protein H2199_006316 [Cladosporium sp. JES 115]KAJ9658828.1 hypothetical protein H2201_007609 [Coniosporium apollinis]